jgi:superfamily I DNA/RNA helicase
LQDHLSDLDAWGADLDRRDGDDVAGAGDELPVSVSEEEAREAAGTLARLGREYLETEGGRGTLAGFLAWAEVATRGEHDDAVHNGVGLLTFHRAKGLEWRIVCVSGLERGLVPIAYAQHDAALAEERRLLHVALSRAHDELHLSWARVRTLGSTPSPRTPSPWLDAPIAASVPGPADRVPDPQVALSDVRRTLAAARPPEPRRQRAPRRAR